MTKVLVINPAGMIELPEEALDALRVKPGDSIRLRTLANGEVVLEAQTSILDLYGSIDPKGICLTVEEMDEIIAEEAVRSVSN